MSTAGHGEVLATRKYGPSELGYVRDQARFYHTMAKTHGERFTLFTGLEPACAACASDQLDDDPQNAAYRCRECGSLSSSLNVIAGRLTRR